MCAVFALILIVFAFAHGTNAFDALVQLTIWFFVVAIALAAFRAILQPTRQYSFLAGCIGLLVLVLVRNAIPESPVRRGLRDYAVAQCERLEQLKKGSDYSVDFRDRHAIRVSGFGNGIVDDTTNIDFVCRLRRRQYLVGEPETTMTKVNRTGREYEGFHRTHDHRRDSRD